MSEKINFDNNIEKSEKGILEDLRKYGNRTEIINFLKNTPEGENIDTDTKEGLSNLMQEILNKGKQESQALLEVYSDKIGIDGLQLDLQLNTDEKNKIQEYISLLTGELDIDISPTDSLMTDNQVLSEIIGKEKVEYIDKIYCENTRKLDQESISELFNIVDILIERLDTNLDIITKNVSDDQVNSIYILRESKDILRILFDRLQPILSSVGLTEEGKQRKKIIIQDISGLVDDLFQISASLGENSRHENTYETFKGNLEHPFQVSAELIPYLLEGKSNKEILDFLKDFHEKVDGNNWQGEIEKAGYINVSGELSRQIYKKIKADGTTEDLMRLTNIITGREGDIDNDLRGHIFATEILYKELVERGVIQPSYLTREMGRKVTSPKTMIDNFTKTSEEGRVFGNIQNAELVLKAILGEEGFQRFSSEDSNFIDNPDKYTKEEKVKLATIDKLLQNLKDHRTKQLDIVQLISLSEIQANQEIKEGAMNDFRWMEQDLGSRRNRRYIDPSLIDEEAKLLWLTLGDIDGKGFFNISDENFETGKEVAKFAGVLGGSILLGGGVGVGILALSGISASSIVGGAVLGASIGVASVPVSRGIYVEGSDSFEYGIKDVGSDLLINGPLGALSGGASSLIINRLSGTIGKSFLTKVIEKAGGEKNSKIVTSISNVFGKNGGKLDQVALNEISKITGLEMKALSTLMAETGTSLAQTFPTILSTDFLAGSLDMLAGMKVEELRQRYILGKDEVDFQKMLEVGGVIFLIGFLAGNGKQVRQFIDSNNYISTVQSDQAIRREINRLANENPEFRHLDDLMNDLRVGMIDAGDRASLQQSFYGLDNTMRVNRMRKILKEYGFIGSEEDLTEGQWQRFLYVHNNVHGDVPIGELTQDQKIQKLRILMSDKQHLGESIPSYIAQAMTDSGGAGNSRGNTRIFTRENNGGYGEEYANITYDELITKLQKTIGIRDLGFLLQELGYNAVEGGRYSQFGSNFFNQANFWLYSLNSGIEHFKKSIPEELRIPEVIDKMVYELNVYVLEQKRNGAISIKGPGGFEPKAELNFTGMSEASIARFMEENMGDNIPNLKVMLSNPLIYKEGHRDLEDYISLIIYRFKDELPIELRHTDILDRSNKDIVDNMPSFLRKDTKFMDSYMYLINITRYLRGNSNVYGVSEINRVGMSQESWSKLNSNIKYLNDNMTSIPSSLMGTGDDKMLKIRLLMSDNIETEIMLIQKLLSDNSLGDTARTIYNFFLQYPSSNSFSRADTYLNSIGSNVSTRENHWIQYKDMLTIGMKSNNESLRGLLNGLKEMDHLIFAGIDNLDNTQIKTLTEQLNSVRLLILSSKLPGRERIVHTNISEEVLLDNLSEIRSILKIDDNEKTIGDRLAEMFFGPIGHRDLDSVINYMDDNIQITNKRGIDLYNESSDGGLQFGIGDVVWAFRDKIFDSALQDGYLSPNHLIGTSPNGADRTPFDIDTIRLQQDDITGNMIYDVNNFTKADSGLNTNRTSLLIRYGNILAVTRSELFEDVTIDGGISRSNFRNNNSREAYTTPVTFYNQTGIRTGVASTEISYYIAPDDPQVLNNMVKDLARRGIYTPIVNRRGEPVFSPQDYIKEREKLGLENNLPD